MTQALSVAKVPAVSNGTAYVRPTLVKGPVLAAITATLPISGKQVRIAAAVSLESLVIAFDDFAGAETSRLRQRGVIAAGIGRANG